MKKGLLFLFALTLGIATGQAQVNKTTVLSKAKSFQKAQKMDFTKEYDAPLMKKSSRTSRRAAGDITVMYPYPAGAFYYGLSDEGYSYMGIQMLTGAFDDTEFTNYTSKEEADGSFTRLTDVTWDWGTTEAGEAITPIAEKVDEDGSMIAQAFGSMKFPTLKYGEEPPFDYVVTDEESGTSYPSYWTAGTEGIADFEFSDGNGGTEVYKGTVGNYIPGLGMYSGFQGGYGFISNKNFYNKENTTTLKPWNNTGKKLIGFVEYYVKPVSYVYAESVVAWFTFSGVKDKTKPLGGKTVKATIYTFTDDGMVEYASATATDADVVIVSEQYSMCSIEFKFQESDPIMGDVDAPIALPDENFVVMLTGFDDVTGNFTSLITSADGWSGYGYALLEDGSISTIGYSNDPDTPQVSLPIGFRAALPVATYAEANLPAVLFETEGGEGIGVKSGEKYYYGSIIYTMSPKDMWETVEKPDWITTVELDDEEVSTYGAMYVSLTAEALPSGTDERSGKVVLEVLGKQVEIPVYQSPNALGVKNVALDKHNASKSAIYNLAGQRVNNDYKGLIIKDGKKMIRK